MNIILFNENPALIFSEDSCVDCGKSYLEKRLPENRIPESPGYIPCYVPLSDFRARHIVDVLSLKAGDSFFCGIVNKSEGVAEIESFDSSGIYFNYFPKNAPRCNPLALIVAQVRPICMKRILRDAAMLGCARLVLTGADTAEKSYSQSTLYSSGEYKKFILDGAMQSGRASVPEVLFAENSEEAVLKSELPPILRERGFENVVTRKTVPQAHQRPGAAFKTSFEGSFPDERPGCEPSVDIGIESLAFENGDESTKKSIPDLENDDKGSFHRHTVKIILDNKGEETFRLSQMDFSHSDAAILAIGPERGWSDRERGLFAKSGFVSALIGERILRTETAVPAGVSILLSRMGRM